MEKSIQGAVSKAIAGNILAAIESNVKDEMLLAAVEKFIDGYELKSAVSDAIGKRANGIAKKIVESGVYDDKLDKAIRAGFEKSIEGVAEATAVVFREMMLGKDSKETYGTRASALLKYMK